MKQDLREYSDQELSLNVFNTEPVYLAAQLCYTEQELRDLVEQWYFFTEEQFKVLHEDCGPW